MKYLSLSLATLLSLTAAAPASLPLSARFPTGPNIITPSVISQYSVSTGAIDYSTDSGLVGKTGDGKDITTLITFSIPSGLTDKTCSLHFTLDPNDPNTTVEGSGKIDVYSSLKPVPPYDVSAWGPPGNQRNQHLGRLQVVEGGEATILDGYPKTVEAFPCPGEGEYGYEVVGVWDLVRVAWTAGVSGLYIEYN